MNESKLKTGRTGSGSLADIKEDWAILRKPVISCFILFHCSLNLSYMFNHHPYIHMYLRSFFSYYSFFGLEQDFGVFAPKPRDANPHLTAVITYKDGTTKLWTYPRMERIDLFTRIGKERYRKFFDDNLAWPRFEKMWPDLARWVARQNYDDPTNPPTMVSLIRFSSTVLLPEIGLGKPNLPHFEDKVLATYPVKAADLNGEGH